MVAPYFNFIQQAILQALDESNEEILVAVYWFTNRKLFDKLCDKLSEGIKVSLIIHNDYINNREAGLNFQLFVDLGGELYFSTNDHPMHNKFCVIDNKILINGSYNWTYFAERTNSENILIVRDESETINAFRSEFINLKKNLENFESVHRLTQFEIDEFNGLSAREYLANDIVYEAKATNKPEIIESAFKLAPSNLRVQKIAVQLDLTKKRILKCSVGAELRFNRYLVGVEKGTELPVSISKIVVTSEANQQNCRSRLYYGDNKKADFNKQMGYVQVNNLPRMPAGEAKLKFIFTIDIYGKLLVRFYSLDNGRSDYFRTDLNSLLSTIA